MKCESLGSSHQSILSSFFPNVKSPVYYVVVRNLGQTGISCELMGIYICYLIDIN